MSEDRSANEPEPGEDPTAAMRRAILMYEQITNFFEKRGRKSVLTKVGRPPSVVRTAKTGGKMFLSWALDVARMDDFEFTVAVGESLANPVGTLHYSSALNAWEISVREPSTGPRLGFEQRDNARLSGTEIQRLLERMDAFVHSFEPAYP